MSQRKQDGTEELLGCLGMLLFGAIAAPLAYFFKSREIPLEVQLRQLDPPAIWGKVIRAKSCSKCETLNSAEQEICFKCGAPFAREIVPKPKSDQPGSVLGRLIVFIILFSIFVFISHLFIQLIGG